LTIGHWICIFLCQWCRHLQVQASNHRRHLINRSRICCQCQCCKSRQVPTIHSLGTRLYTRATYAAIYG
jgi:hypothetical protein